MGEVKLTKELSMPIRFTPTDTSGSIGAMMEVPMKTTATKAQAQWLRYLSRHGYAELTGVRDLEMADRLIEKGFAKISELRPGFYSLHITDAGRRAVGEVR